MREVRECEIHTHINFGHGKLCLAGSATAVDRCMWLSALFALCRLTVALEAANTAKNEMEEDVLSSQKVRTLIPAALDLQCSSCIMLYEFLCYAGQAAVD